MPARMASPTPFEQVGAGMVTVTGDDVVWAQREIAQMVAQC